MDCNRAIAVAYRAQCVQPLATLTGPAALDPIPSEAVFPFNLAVSAIDDVLNRVSS
jgi:hypothetical protein